MDLLIIQCDYILCGQKIGTLDNGNLKLMGVLLHGTTVADICCGKRMKNLSFFFIHLTEQCMQGLVVSRLHLHTPKHIFSDNCLSKKYLHLTFISV